MSENVFKSDEPKVIARGQAVVEAKQTLDRECKVLSVNASAVLTPAEVFTGEARYLGKVTFDILVITDGAVDCITLVSDYSDKITSPEITASAALALIPEVVNVEATVEGGAVKAVAVVDAIAFGAASSQCEILAEPDDGIYIQTEDVEHTVVCDEQTETIYITDSISAGKAKRILFVDSSAVVTGAEPADGEVKVSGAVYSCVYVVTDGEPISAVKIVTPYVRSIPADCRAEGYAAIVTPCVADCAASLEGDIISLAATVRVNITVCEKKTTAIATDVFCAGFETQANTHTVDACFIEQPAAVIDTVDGQIPIPPEIAGADAVLCVLAKSCAVSGVIVDGGRITVEGLVSGDIIYYNSETNAAEPFAVSLPFSMPLAVHTDAGSADVRATVTDMTVRVRRGSVFDIKAELCFNVLAAKRRTVTAVGSVKLGAETERPDAAVIIHIAKPGETLWQAARALCCSPDEVKNANPKEPPYEGGERLIRFCGK